MADAPAQKSSFGFLARKIGPVPVWLIGVAAVGAYYWYKHYGPGARPAAVPAAATARPEVIDVTGQRGPRGFRGGRGPRGYRDRDRPPDRDPVHRTRDSYAAGPRGAAPAVAPPVQAAAPTTGADVYGDVPVASPGGYTYDSGDVASTMGAQYAVAG